MKKSHRNVFGRVLRELRMEKGISQETLGFDAERDRTYISLLEKGRRSPTLDTMLALCHALDMTLVQLAKKIEARLEENHDTDDPT